MGEDDIEIDFGKITKFFKRDKKKAEQKEAADDQVQGSSAEETPKSGSPEIKEGIKEGANKSAKGDHDDGKNEAGSAQQSGEDAQKDKESAVKKKQNGAHETKDDKEEQDGDEKGQSDDEIAIDFSKITGIFRKKEAREKEKSEAQKKQRVSEERKKKPESADLEKKQNEKEQDSEDAEEEISFDFSKVKGLFKAKGRKEDAEEKVDVQPVVHFVKKNSKVLIMLILLLIPLYIGMEVRTYPNHLPIADDMAKEVVQRSIQAQIIDQVNNQYPNLPAAQRQKILEKEYQRVVKENQAGIDQQVQLYGNYIRAQMKVGEEDSQTYLLAIDPYHWARYARNIADHGYPGDDLREGQSYDTLMHAPLGRYVSGDRFHAYFEAYLYKFVRLFDKDADFQGVIFTTPIIIIVLGIIPTFFLARMIAGDIAGFVAALIIAVHPAVMSRTVGGFADTDPYQILFPLLISLLFMWAYELKKVQGKILLVTFAGLLVGLYASAWRGYWHILDFLMVVAITQLSFYLLVHWSEVKKGLFSKEAVTHGAIILITFILASGMFIGVFSEHAPLDIFREATGQPVKFSTAKDVGITSIWPNVLTTVAEQNEASRSEIISTVGFGGKSAGKFLFFLCFFGIAVAVTERSWKRKKDMVFLGASAIYYLVIISMNDRIENTLTLFFLLAVPLIIKAYLAIDEKDEHIRMRYAALIFVWIIATMYASQKGIRFTLMMVPALAIGLGVAVAFLFELIDRYASREMKVEKYLITGFLFLLLFLALYKGPVAAGKEVAKNQIPGMNDAWWSALERIDGAASQDAIITSWWDYGHWFKFVAKRGVTFDGASQNLEPAHWVGLVLLTENETEAKDILRFLTCGNFYTHEFLLRSNWSSDPYDQVMLLKEIIPQSREEARQTLIKKGFPEGSITQLLDYTHCDPPEDYFIASDDMVSKSGVWAHFGIWDFKRAYIYNTLIKQEYASKEKAIAWLGERFDMPTADAEKMYNDVRTLAKADSNSWISPWPSYVQGVQQCNQGGDILQCPQGIMFNLTSEEAYIINPDKSVTHPKAVAFAATNDTIVKKYSENIHSPEFGIAIIPADGKYYAVLMDPRLTGSLFTRMFFFQGHGLRYFDAFSVERNQVLGTQVYTYKVDWNGTDPNIAPLFPEDSSIEENSRIDASKASNETAGLGNDTRIIDSDKGNESKGSRNSSARSKNISSK